MASVPLTAEVSEQSKGQDPESNVVRIPALDGVRALGITLVICFHGGLSWASGGFLGVDVFFVLSGFLITGLLVAEFRQHRGIGLLRFWGHRIRRLFPALLAVLTVVALYAWLLAPPDTLDQIRGDALATLFYVNNWHLIAGSHGYFAELATPRPLLHTWSLSIEEQFYVLWPLLVLVILRWTRSLRSLLIITIALGLASALAMGVLFHPGLGATRDYYGTDTRVQALLVGAALAIVLARPLPTRSGADPSGSLLRDRRLSSTQARVMRGLGIVGIVVIGTMAVIVDAGSSWPYRGGFLLVAIATAALICSVCLVPDGPIARLLSLRPIRYIGAISYGLYLWHWPIFVVLSAQRTGLTGLALFALRVSTSMAAAVLSYHLLEMPIRRGTWLRSRRGWLALPLTAGLVVAAVLLATTVAPIALPANAGAGLSLSERSALAQAGAFDHHPIRFMLFGDSLALTMAFGLGYDTRSWGVQSQFANPTLGCDLDPIDRIVVSGAEAPAGQGCVDWRHHWAASIDRLRPEVVGVLLGRWEIVDHLHDGVWMHIGQPAWDAHLTAELRQVVAAAQRQGARVVFFTLPYFNAPTAPDGTVYPENSRARIDAYNAVLRRIADTMPDAVSIYDLNAVVDPHGVFEWSAGGQQIRMSDGVHFTPYAGGWLRPKILPFVAELGLQARDHRG